MRVEGSLAPLLPRERGFGGAQRTLTEPSGAGRRAYWHAGLARHGRDMHNRVEGEGVCAARSCLDRRTCCARDSPWSISRLAPRVSPRDKSIAVALSCHLDGQCRSFPGWRCCPVIPTVSGGSLAGTRWGARAAWGHHELASGAARASISARSNRYAPVRPVSFMSGVSRPDCTCRVILDRSTPRSVAASSVVTGVDCISHILHELTLKVTHCTS